MIIDTTRTNSNGNNAKIKMGDIVQFQKMVREHNNAYLCRFKVHKGNCECHSINHLMQSFNAEIERKFVIHLKEQNNNRNIGIAMIVTGDNDSNEGDVDDLVNENWLVNNVLNDDRDNKTRKYSMAQCGLESERNAFVCIEGTDIFLKNFIQESSNTLKDKIAKGIDLHRDACDHLVRLTATELKTNLLYQIRNKLGDQGMSTDRLQRYQEMEYGPHLKSAIKSKDFEYLVDGESAKVLVMVKLNNEHRGNYKIVLEIPGGKRELGETSVDCAVREVYEEAHISLDRQMLENATIDDTVENSGRFYFVRE
jgi:hypothetical protein